MDKSVPVGALFCFYTRDYQKDKVPSFQVMNKVDWEILTIDLTNLHG
ncbi:hypothetical protein [Chryseobacterium tongliaoense]